MLHGKCDGCGRLLSAGSQALEFRCDLLDKQKTNSDARSIARIGKARKYNLLVCCRHCISNDLVLKFNWKVIEGEDVLDLAVFNGKYLSIKCY